MVLNCRTLVAFIMIFAFVSAQISPACAFVSGRGGMIEICAEDGSIQTIQVSAQYDISALLSKKDTTGDHDHRPKDMSKECSFCFAQSHMAKGQISAPLTFSAPAPSDMMRIGAGTIVYSSYSGGSFQPRAPPALS